METNQEEIIVGLDIGTTKIACIVGRLNEHEKLEILGSGISESFGVSRGVVSNIEKTIESITKAVREAEVRSGCSIKSVYVGVAGEHIKSIQQRGSIIRNSLDTEVSQSDIDKLVNNMYKLVVQPGEEIIHVIPQEFTLDNEPGIKEPIGMCGISLEAVCHVIIGKISAAKNIQKCISKSELELEGLILEPLASADAVLSEEEKEAGVALVDIGGGTTDIAIFHDKILRHTAVIPLGGNSVTNDVKEACGIIRDHAEAVKVKFGSALSNLSNEDIVSIPGLRGRPAKEIQRRNLAQIIQARVEEIMELVDNELAKSGYTDKLSAGIVLTGGGSLLKDIIQLTEFVTGKETRIGQPNTHLSSNSPEEISTPQYATGIGLVLRGIDDSKRKNTHQPEQEEKTSTKKRDGFFTSFLTRTKDYLNSGEIR